jgi:nitrate reductase beta subunit
MFGPGVDHAIERYTHPSRELLAVLQLFRAAQRIVFTYEIEEGRKIGDITVAGKRQPIYDDTVVGYDSDGGEIVRVNVAEPLFERRGKLNSI